MLALMDAAFKDCRISGNTEATPLMIDYYFGGVCLFLYCVFFIFACLNTIFCLITLFFKCVSTHFSWFSLREVGLQKYIYILLCYCHKLLLEKVHFDVLLG